MIFDIDVQNEHDYPVNVARLRDAAAAALRLQAARENDGLTVVVADDAMVQELNRQFRGIDAPTDVLSFPADSLSDLVPAMPRYLGDILIAYPYASAQAAAENHPVQDSMALLVVHGVLHLLGFDHDTAENRAAMWAAQDAILAQLGIAPDIVPALERYRHEADETDRGPTDEHDED